MDIDKIIEQKKKEFERIMADKRYKNWHGKNDMLWAWVETAIKETIEAEQKRVKKEIERTQIQVGQFGTWGCDEVIDILEILKEKLCQ